MKVLSKLVKFLSVFAGSCGSVLAIVLFSDYTYPAIGWYIAVCIAITALLVYSYGTILENSIICREILQEQKEKPS